MDLNRLNRYNFIPIFVWKKLA